MLLGVPTLCNRGGLDSLILSAELGTEPPSGYVIVANGEPYPIARVEALVSRAVRIDVICEGRNLGVAASWNRILAAAAAEPVVIANDDVILGRRTLADFATALRFVPLASAADFALFGITSACVAAVGKFDERFWPAYLEDCDYAHRMAIAGIQRAVVDPPITHEGNGTLHRADPETRKLIEHGIEAGREYYARKWGAVRIPFAWSGPEKFRTPFDGSYWHGAS